jgi:hypothetical protein
MCKYCGCETDFLTGYVCSRCGETYCIDCRMPEVHKCEKQLERTWSNYAMNVKRMRAPSVPVIFAADTEKHIVLALECSKFIIVKNN